MILSGMSVQHLPGCANSYHCEGGPASRHMVGTWQDDIKSWEARNRVYGGLFWMNGGGGEDSHVVVLSATYGEPVKHAPPYLYSAVPRTILDYVSSHPFLFDLHLSSQP